jgi:hypothetical protein
MAMMSAKRLLTNSLGEVISSRMTEIASQTNGGDDLTLSKEIVGLVVRFDGGAKPYGTGLETVVRGHHQDTFHILYK